MNIPESKKLEVSKALRQLQFVDRSYNLGIWPTEESKRHLEYDMAIMHQFDDLKEIWLELLGADRTVLFEFRIGFGGNTNGERMPDTANGIELPVLDLGAVVDKRVLLQRLGKEDQYRHLLRIPWGNTTNNIKRAGDSYSSEHTAKITGGRQTGAFHVSAEARRRLVVTRAGNNGFAFAKDIDRETADVFLHAKFAPPGFRFYVGQRLSAIIVQTPRGLQARNIQEMNAF